MTTKFAQPMTNTQARNDTDYQWMVGAACKNAPDANLFFEYTEVAQQEAIDKYCLSCPVMDACFEFAFAHPSIAGYGIWGGRTANELASLRRKASRKRK